MVYNTKLFGVKLFAFLLIIAVLTGQYIGGAFNVYAAETGTKAATLTDIKVSFNGAEPVTIQAYTVDGSNYVRARAITDGVDMKVDPVLNGKEVGIYITPEKPAQETAQTDALKDTDINIALVDGKISFGGIPYYGIKCFNYKDRYYYKVGDIFAAADNSLNEWTQSLEKKAKAGMKKGPIADSFSSISVELSSDTGIIEVKRTEYDFNKMFEDFRGGRVSTVTAANTSVIPERISTQAEQMPLKPEIKRSDIVTDISVKTQLSAQAPEIGSQPANILKDENIGAYKANGNPNRDNFQPIYNKPISIGQCTWYAACRFEEVTEIDVVNAKAPNTLYDTDVPKWVEAAKSGKCPDLIGISDKNAIEAHCIAVWDGHVLFVEYVEYDTSGNPTNIYFTEANSGNDGIYRPGQDCIIQKASFDEFVSLGSYTNKGSSVLGYIMAK